MSSFIIKRLQVKKRVPRARLSFMSAWELLRSLENWDKQLATAQASLNFFYRVLKQIRVLL